MRIALTFWLMIFLGTLFLLFQDIKEAQKEAIPVESLTLDQDLIARKNVTLYKTHYHDYFLLSDDKIKAATLLYDLCQYFIILSLTYMVWERSSREEVNYVITFFVINVIDLFDYFLTHNGTFFYIGAVPITWNTCSVLFYSIISIYIYHGSSTSNR